MYTIRIHCQEDDQQWEMYTIRIHCQEDDQWEMYTIRIHCQEDDQWEMYTIRIHCQEDDQQWETTTGKEMNITHSGQKSLINNCPFYRGLFFDNNGNVEDKPFPVWKESIEDFTAKRRLLRRVLKSVDNNPLLVLH